MTSWSSWQRPTPRVRARPRRRPRQPCSHWTGRLQLAGPCMADTQAQAQSGMHGQMQNEVGESGSALAAAACDGHAVNARAARNTAARDGRSPGASHSRRLCRECAAGSPRRRAQAWIRCGAWSARWRTSGRSCCSTRAWPGAARAAALPVSAALRRARPVHSRHGLNVGGCLRCRRNRCKS